MFIIFKKLIKFFEISINFKFNIDITNLLNPILFIIDVIIIDSDLKILVIWLKLNKKK